MASSTSSSPVPPLPVVITSILSSIAEALALIGQSPTDASIANTRQYASIPLYNFLADFANLSKAHATKLGLITNPPITESSHPAIARILLEIQKDVLPVVSSAPYIADRNRYGMVTHVAVCDGAKDLLKALEEMVKGIQSNTATQITTGSGQKDKGKGRQDINITDLREALPSITKSPYTSTGQIWHAADKILAISQKHLIGLVESSLQNHAEMLKDCIQEFKEWVEDAAEELKGEDSGFDEDESQSNSVHESFDDDDFFGMEGGDKTKVTKEVYAVAEAILKKLKMTSILYTAILKRRIRDPASGLGGIIHKKATEEGEEYSIETERNYDRLEKIEATSKLLSGEADNLAWAFYSDEGTDGITAKRETFVQTAVRLAEACKSGGDGGEDAPSAWFTKFIENINT
ncbi:hypothetical protein TWF694_000095 [Orbilia ellipsospora]|uniref:Uncharacterized protein n=1 Tax=Orbilia ellipsospora TaxID=2528407 RepID=A0AAV9XQ69_9PEZI